MFASLLETIKICETTRAQASLLLGWELFYVPLFQLRIAIGGNYQWHCWELQFNPQLLLTGVDYWIHL